MTTNHHIALIPGDGIGAEVLPPAQQVLDVLGRRHGFTLSYTSYDDWSCERYLREGAMMPSDGIDQLRDKDAILLGAVGYPGVPDHVSLWGLLIPIRRSFRQYVNLRPIRVFEGIDSPVRGARPGEVDFVVVRENMEGEYSEVGGRLNRGFPDEIAVQEAVFTRAGVTRVLDYAFTLASQRGGRLTSATKSNGIVHTMPFWDQLVTERAASFPQVAWGQEHIDALAAKFVLEPPGSTSSSPPTSSATSSATSRPRSPDPSASPRRPTSTPSGTTPRCSSRCTAPRPTSRARASRTRWARSGRLP